MKLDKSQAAMWFSLGILAGALLMGGIFRYRSSYRKRVPDPEHVIERFSKGLDLSADQHQNLRKVILANHPKFEAFHREYKEKKRKLSEDVRSEIKTFLTAEQRASFDKRIAQRKERRAQRRKP